MPSGESVMTTLLTLAAAVALGVGGYFLARRKGWLAAARGEDWKPGPWPVAPGGVMGMYSSMEGVFQHQLMAGVFLEIPIQQKRRQGALDEALAIRARAESEEERLVDEIRAQVEEAVAKVEESRKVLT